MAANPQYADHRLTLIGHLKLAQRSLDRAVDALMAGEDFSVHTNLHGTLQDIAAVLGTPVITAQQAKTPVSALCRVLDAMGVKYVFDTKPGKIMMSYDGIEPADKKAGLAGGIVHTNAVYRDYATTLTIAQGTDFNHYVMTFYFDRDGQYVTHRGTDV